MITAGYLDRLADALQRTGVSREAAGRYAVLVGDTPELDGDQVVVREDDGTELARFPASLLD